MVTWVWWCDTRDKKHKYFTMSLVTRAISSRVSLPARNRPDHLFTLRARHMFSVHMTGAHCSLVTMCFMSRRFPVVFLKSKFVVYLFFLTISWSPLSDTVWLSEIACFTFHRSQTFGGGSFHIFIILTKTACRKLLMVLWNVQKILSEPEIYMQIFKNSKISRIYIDSQRYDMEAFEWIERVTPRNVVNCKALGRQL